MKNNYYKLKSSNIMPKFGIGTWGIGENKIKREREIDNIVFALKHGIRLIDTAEMYGNGEAESLIGEALKEHKCKREDIYIISKVYPHNAGKDNIFNSLESSLKRLGVDYLDMYLLHWRGRIPLSETVECMENAKKEGLIKDWGVSNFDIDDMKELETVKGGNKCAANQVLYHLGSRGIDFDLAPYMEKNNIALISYCPLARNGELGKDLLEDKVLIDIAKKYNATAAQIALAFISAFENRIPIPKSAHRKHTIENIKSQDIILKDEDIEILNKEFPAPTKKMPLDIV